MGLFCQLIPETPQRHRLTRKKKVELITTKFNSAYLVKLLEREVTYHMRRKTFS